MFHESITDLSVCVTDVLYATSCALIDVQQMRCHICRFSLNCREKGVRRSSFFEKRTSFTPISVTTKNSRCLSGWSAVYSSDENVTQVIGSAVGNQRRERECFFSSFRRMKDVEISLNNFRYVRES